MAEQGTTTVDVAGGARVTVEPSLAGAGVWVEVRSSVGDVALTLMDGGELGRLVDALRAAWLVAEARAAAPAEPMLR